MPVLEKFSGLKFNQDFFCGYSPERINPGDKVNTLTTIKKITSGSTPESALVVIGVNERGEKRFLAIEDGVRESTQSWREVLLDLKSRGMNAPRLAVGDGAMGFWAALEEVYGQTRQQRCWMHKTANVLNCVPKSIQPRVKSALHEIWQAATKDDAQRALNSLRSSTQPSIPEQLRTYKRTARS